MPHIRFTRTKYLFVAAILVLCFTLFDVCIVRCTHMCIYLVYLLLWWCAFPLPPLPSLHLSHFFFISATSNSTNKKRKKKKQHQPEKEFKETHAELAFLRFNLHTVHILCHDTTRAPFHKTVKTKDISKSPNFLRISQ